MPEGSREMDRKVLTTPRLVSRPADGRSSFRDYSLRVNTNRQTTPIFDIFTESEDLIEKRQKRCALTARRPDHEDWVLVTDLTGTYTPTTFLKARRVTDSAL